MEPMRRVLSALALATCLCAPALAKQAPARNGPTSAIAARQIPVLQKHLRIAQSLQNGGRYSGR
jgi:hypothetical protein